MTDRRSWTALSAGFGLPSLPAALGFRVPERLTSRELRAVDPAQHHARDRAFADSDDAIHAPWIDRPLGTFALPDAPRGSDAYGLPWPRQRPAGCRAQFASPCVREPRDGGH